MGNSNKVVWHEGQFLLPQLFQQQDRHFAQLVHRRVKAAQRLFWGLTDYAFDTEALQIGKFQLTRVAGILADGTPFDAPADNALPPPLALKGEHVGKAIHLALPATRAQGIEIGFDEGVDDTRNALTRYRVVEADLADVTSIAPDRSGKAVQLADLRLRYLVAEANNTDDWVSLPLAMVSEIASDGSAKLDESVIPPVIDCRASPLLMRWLSEVAALVHARADSLADSIAAGGARSEAREVTDFLLLQLLNRFDPRLQHRLQLPAIAPEAMFRELVTLAAELSTFIRLPARRPNKENYGGYRHDAPYACFAPLMQDIREMLNVVLERAAQRIDLTAREHGVYQANIDPSLLSRFANLVFAVSAQMPADNLASQFPAQAKVGPAGLLSDLIRSHLAGLPLQLLPVPPRQIPFNAGFVYFEIDQKNALWDQVAQYGGLGLHVAGNFPSLHMELWGIRG